MATPKIEPKAGKLNMVIEQGATFNPVLTWKDANDAAIDLADWTARMHIRAEITDADPLLTLTTEDGGITLGGAAGTISLLISAADTADLDWESGVYDLEMVSPSGIVTRLLKGTVTVQAEVTR